MVKIVVPTYFCDKCVKTKNQHVLAPHKIVHVIKGVKPKVQAFCDEHFTEYGRDWLRYAEDADYEDIVECGGDELPISAGQHVGEGLPHQPALEPVFELNIPELEKKPEPAEEVDTSDDAVWTTCGGPKGCGERVLRAARTEHVKDKSTGKHVGPVRVYDIEWSGHWAYACTEHVLCVANKLGFDTAGMLSVHHSRATTLEKVVVDDPVLAIALKDIDKAQAARPKPTIGSSVVPMPTEIFKQEDVAECGLCTRKVPFSERERHAAMHTGRVNYRRGGPREQMRMTANEILWKSDLPKKFHCEEHVQCAITGFYFPNTEDLEMHVQGEKRFVHVDDAVAQCPLHDAPMPVLVDEREAHAIEEHELFAHQIEWQGVNGWFECQVHGVCREETHFSFPTLTQTRAHELEPLPK